MLNSIARSRVRSTRSPAHSHFGHTSRPIALCLLSTAQKQHAVRRACPLASIKIYASRFILGFAVEHRIYCKICLRTLAAVAARCRWACSVLIQYKLRVRMANETTAEGDESTALQRGVFFCLGILSSCLAENSNNSKL